jgi:hypothetical protein
MMPNRGPSLAGTPPRWWAKAMPRSGSTSASAKEADERIATPKGRR